MKLLVCGGAGFIGSAFIRNHFYMKPKDEIINLDNLSLGSNLSNLSSMESNSNYKFIKGDIRDKNTVDEIFKNVDIVINFAAETHVDRSISNPQPFIDTNILGTYALLEAARKHDKFLFHVSTDEIYGDAKNKKSFSENDSINPSNPYSASKASADNLVSAYQRTYGLKCITSRCTNNFGPNQFPEKLVPKTIILASKNLPIPLYGGGHQIRSWIYVLDHVQAIESLIEQGTLGEVYNITAWNEITNRSIIEKILEIMKKPNDLIEIVDDRPGHDERYSMDASKIRKTTGWKPRYDLDNALEETVSWYQNNKWWWEPLSNEKTLHPQPWNLNW